MESELMFYSSAYDLGTFVVVANLFGPLEAVLSTSLACPVAVIPVVSHRRAGQDLWVIQSFDQVSGFMF